MKTKLAGLFIWVGMILITTLYTYKALGSTPDTIYHSIEINLKDFYGKEKLQALNEKLYNAAVKDEIKAYKIDSFTSFLVTEEILYSNTTKPENTNDTVYNDICDSSGKLQTRIQKYYFSNNISFKSIFYQEENGYKLEFTGFSFNYNWFLDQKFYFTMVQYYISKEDIIKILGKKEGTGLFANCYKAMLKSINDDKLETPDNKTSCNFTIGDYIGENLLQDISSKMYYTVTRGLLKSNKDIPAYKTCNLNAKYTIDELLKRGCLSESVQIPESEDPNAKIIDTIIENPFRPSGNKLYSVYLKWSYNQEKIYAVAKISAIGMFVPYSYESKPEKFYTLFWLDWKDAEAIYTPIEMSIMKYAFFKSIMDFKYSLFK